jgi:hypothetical protein
MFFTGSNFLLILNANDLRIKLCEEPLSRKAGIERASEKTEI